MVFVGRPTMGVRTGVGKSNDGVVILLAGKTRKTQIAHYREDSNDDEDDDAEERNQRR